MNGDDEIEEYEYSSPRRFSWIRGIITLIKWIGYLALFTLGAGFVIPQLPFFTPICDFQWFGWCLT